MENEKKIFSEIIKRQIAILGPQITLDRVRKVPGIQLDQNGDVVGLTGDPQLLLQQLINQFVELSGLIVQKTMESILASHPNDMVVIGQAPVMQIGYGLSGSEAIRFPPLSQDYKVTDQVLENNVSSPSSVGSDMDDSASSEAAAPGAVDNAQKNLNNNIKGVKPDLAGATRDIEDLNKMLNQSSS